MLLLVGGYTLDMGEDVPGKARGVSAYDFSPNSGEIIFRGDVEATNPSYLCVNPERRLVYAVRECPPTADPGVITLRVARSGGKVVLEKIDDHVLDGGDHPCFLTRVLDSLIVCSYDNGTVDVLQLDGDGRPQTHLQHIDLGQGGKAHCAAYDAVRNRVYVCDLGQDRLWVYKRNDNGTLRALPEAHLQFSQGLGLRHIMLHPAGDRALVNFEYSGRAALLDLTGAGPSVLQTITYLPERVVDRVSAAALRVHPSGKWAFVSERDYSLVSTLSLDGDYAKLKAREAYPSGGDYPRDILLSPSGRWLLAANLRDHTVGSFRVGGGGKLRLERVMRGVKSPTSMAWMPGV